MKNKENEEINFNTTHGQRRTAMKEYLKEINNSKDKEAELAKIIKSEKRTIINTIQTILMIIILIGIIWLQIQGKYTNTQIIEICNGAIINGTGII